MAKDRVNPKKFDTAIGSLAPGGGWPQGEKNCMVTLGTILAKIRVNNPMRRGVLRGIK